MLKNLKIGFRLWGGFIAVIVLTVVVGVTALINMKSLSNLTVDLYEHPLTVSNAIRDARINIIAMHRHMKDVALADNIIEVGFAHASVNKRERVVYRNFATISDRYLGPKEDVAEALEVFRQWHDIREDVVNNMKVGQSAEAEAITKEQGAQHIDLLESKMKVLLDYADVRADTFIRDSKNRYRITSTTVAVLLALTFVIGAFIAIVTTRGITGPIGRLTNAMALLAKGDVSIAISDTDRKDEIGELAQAARVFRESSEKTEEQNWIKTNITEISAKLQAKETAKSFATTLNGILMPLLECGIGVFYAFDEDKERLELLSAYGYKKRKSLNNVFMLGEGLVGQCALERKSITISSIPDDYIHINSGLGEHTPASIAALPVLHLGKLLGVLEIGTFKPFSKLQEHLLAELLPVIAINLENLLRAERTERLLVKPQEQANALQLSEAELKTSEEELTAVNEELTEKARLLERQAARLQASEEEQRVVNEELVEKTRTLEEQQRRLETAQKATEEKATQLEVASQYKSEFLANMSHELRTPLNSLLILSKSLADNEDGGLNEEHVESASIIYDSGSQLLKLINDILDLSKVEAGRMEVNGEAISVVAFAEAIKRRFQPLAGQKGLEFSVKLAEGVPDEIHSDGGKVEQIVTNLAGNAMKFTEQGSVSVELSIVADDAVRPYENAPDSPILSIAIIDTGIGIAKDRRHDIFGAFRQADGTTSRRFGGTGLGLSISQKLANLLGGSIELSSVEGVGSRFTLYIPVSAPSGPSKTFIQPQTSAKLAVNRAPSVNGERPKADIDDDRDAITDGDHVVLVIEDDLKFAKIMRDRARKKGFKCLVAANGERGIQLAHHFEPDGIVLDVYLPDTEGWSVLSRLKQDSKTRSIPVHFISASDESARGLELGAVGFVSKPVSRTDIEQVFERLEHFADGATRKLLVVEDDPGSRRAIAELISGEEVDITNAESGEEALSLLEENTFDCMILDLGLPGMSGFEFLRRASNSVQGAMPPVIIYSARDLTDAETMQLREFTDSIVIKGARSPERLLDEVTLFLHNRKKELYRAEPGYEHPTLRDVEQDLSGRKVLIVDDDMRNTFALSKALRAKGFEVLMAKDGEKGIAQLKARPDTEIVLMDVMMPGMDGMETIQRIRDIATFNKLPIIAVTAKAMLGDQEKCIAAGANDYLSKPIDMDKLLSMIRVWLSA